MMIEPFLHIISFISQPNDKEASAAITRKTDFLV